MRVLFILVLFISNCFADNKLAESIKTLESINKTAQLYQCDASGSYLNHQESESLVEKCLIDVCGLPKENISMVLTDYNFDHYFKEESIKEFSKYEEKFKDLINEEFKKNDDFIKHFEKLYKDKKFEHDFSIWEDWYYSDESQRMFEQYITVKVDKNLPVDKRLSIKINHLPKDKSKIFINGLKDYVQEKKKSIVSSLLHSISYDIYSDEELKDLLKLKINVLMLAVNGIDQKITRYKKKDQEKIMQIINKREKIYQMNKYDLVDFAKDIEEVQSGLVSSAIRKTDDNMYCVSSACKKAVQEEVSKIDIHKLVSNLKKENSRKEFYLNDKMFNCKAEFAMLKIESKEADSFKKIIPEVIKSLDANVLSQYSQETKNKMLKYLNNQLDFSMSVDLKPVEEFISDLESKHSKIKKGAIYFYVSSSFGLYKKIKSYGGDEYTEFSPLNKLSLCRKQYTVWDSFSPRTENLASDKLKDRIYISFYSYKNPKRGKAILAHEIGHALSYAFQNKKTSASSYEEYKKLRLCATNAYKNKIFSKSPLIPEHENDALRTEEDTADLVSFMTLPNKDDIFECALLEPSNDGSTYKNLSLKNRYDEDTHSSTPFRVIREAIHKKIDMPVSCKMVLSENLDNYRFEPCF